MKKPAQWLVCSCLWIVLNQCGCGAASLPASEYSVVVTSSECHRLRFAPYSDHELFVLYHNLPIVHDGNPRVEVSRDQRFVRLDGEPVVITIDGNAPSSTLSETEIENHSFRVIIIENFSEWTPEIFEAIESLADEEFTMSVRVGSATTSPFDLRGLRRFSERLLGLHVQNRIERSSYPAFAELSALRGLYLRHRDIDDALVRAISRNRSLRQLQLEFAHLTSDGYERLARMDSLRELSLTYSSTTDEHLAILSRLSELRVLDLAGTEITDHGLRHLANLTELRSLDISLNGLTDRGFVHLESLTELRWLTLTGASMGDEGLSHLSRMTELRVLRLTGVSIDGSGLSYLSGASQLRELVLSGTEIRDANLAVLSNWPHLERLDLSRTSIGDDGLAHVARLNELRELDLRNTAVTESAIRAFVEQHPRCRLSTRRRCDSSTETSTE